MHGLGVIPFMYDLMNGSMTRSTNSSLTSRMLCGMPTFSAVLAAPSMDSSVQQAVASPLPRVSKRTRLSPSTS